MFEERVSDRIKGVNIDHAFSSNALLNSAREVCDRVSLSGKKVTQKIQILAELGIEQR